MAKGWGAGGRGRGSRHQSNKGEGGLQRRAGVKVKQVFDGGSGLGQAVLATWEAHGCHSHADIAPPHTPAFSHPSSHPCILTPLLTPLVHTQAFASDATLDEMLEVGRQQSGASRAASGAVQRQGSSKGRPVQAVRQVDSMDSVSDVEFF